MGSMDDGPGPPSGVRRRAGHERKDTRAARAYVRHLFRFVGYLDRNTSLFEIRPGALQEAAKAAATKARTFATRAAVQPSPSVDARHAWRRNRSSKGLSERQKFPFGQQKQPSMKRPSLAPKSVNWLIHRVRCDGSHSLRQAGAEKESSQHTQQQNLAVTVHRGTR